MQKVERLVNLIALLLNTRRPLTVDEIRNTVPGYQQQDYSSFKRMFERDKEELRAIGIPVERRYTDVWEVEEGYMIPKDRYYLPELDLTPDELAALWIASHVVVEEGTSEERALLKLSLGTGLGSDPASPPWLRARLHLDAPALPQLLEAVAGRKRISFGYRPAGRSESVRTVDPYALIHRQGAWYVVGHDQNRGAVRHFKLQRITTPVSQVTPGTTVDFDVPADFSTDDRSVTERVPSGGPVPLRGIWVGEEKGTTVEVAFSPRISWWVQQSLGLEPSETWKGWTVVELPVAEEEGFVSWVIGFGEDALVRSPDRVKKLVVDRLRASLPVRAVGAPDDDKTAKPKPQPKAKPNAPKAKPKAKSKR